MTGKYRTIVADPPWPYADGFPQGPAHGVKRATVSLPYPSMTLEEIAALPIGDLADPRGAWLFVWTTNRYLPVSFGLIEGWGFQYTQAITWRKTGCPSPFVRSIAPQHSEYLLVSRRGQVERIGAFPSSVIDAPAQNRHSAKPEAFLDLIEAATPEPRVELFVRRHRFFWDVWGNESANTAEWPESAS
jgi:N6-adenosine-specific RNA methylase IME4